MVRLLLSTKAIDVNARDEKGHTPIWWPAVQGSVHIVKCLVDAGATVDYVDYGGRSLWDTNMWSRQNEIYNILGKASVKAQKAERAVDT
jgi:ankyrin repeat protein